MATDTGAHTLIRKTRLYTAHQKSQLDILAKQTQNEPRDRYIEFKLDFVPVYVGINQEIYPMESAEQGRNPECDCEHTTNTICMQHSTAQRQRSNDVQG